MNIDYRLKFALFLILAAIVFFMFKANNIFENKIVTYQSKSITFKDDTKPIQIGSTDETTYKIKKGDTFYSLLKQLKINPLLINKIVNDENLNSFKTLLPGNEIIFSNIGKKIFLKKFDGKSAVDLMEISGDRFKLKKLTNLNSYVAFKEYKIERSLYESALKAEVPNNIIDELMIVFGWDIDFVFDVRVGDKVKVLYTEFYLEGRLLGNSDILAATFINNGKEFSVFRFSQQGVKDYFSADGKSVKKSFLKTPIEFAAITSPYNLKRKHPILNTIRPHTGTDYRGKTGTPVKVTGDGIVVRANFSNSYGNIIDVKHFNKYLTRYAHLNNFERSIKVGSRVKQGQVIGYVGSTGLATGPHLHYEFRINGKHTNPVNVSMPDAQPINQYNKAAFNKVTKERIGLINNLSSI